jgi:YVTN family beta-propeller protein
LLTQSKLRGRRWVVAGTAAVAVAACGVATAAAAGVIPLNPFGTNQVGQQQADGRILLPDNHWISPYGQRAATFSAQTIGTAISPDGMKIAAQTGGDNSGTPQISILDAATGSVLQSFGGSGVAAPVYSPDGSTLYAATLTSVRKYSVGANGLITNPTAPTVISVGGGAFPYSLAVSGDGTKLYAGLSGQNKLAVIDTSANTVAAQIPVGNAPAGVAVVGNQVFVSNRGGRPAVPGDTTNKSDGTAIVSDPVTGASTTGTVSVVDAATNTVSDTINVGLQPASLTVHDGAVFVTNTNSDTVSIIDAASHKVTQTFNVEPLHGATVGAAPNSVTFADASHLLVSVGRDNAIAVFNYVSERTPVGYKGLIPTDWYPNQVQFDAKVGKVIVSNQQGIGTNGWKQTYKYQGTLDSFSMPADSALEATSQTVFQDNAWDVRHPTGSGNAPGGHAPAIPNHLGQPSAIKHVFLIIKENRTYDQVLGDIGKGNSDPAYTNYGAQVTPNQHSLANTFTLFDNFYDSGMLSADGHNWLLQGDNNDYQAQNAASAWARSYPYPGGDALTYQRDGFLWNTVEAAGNTVRNYGEFEAARTGKQGSWQQYYADSQIMEGKATGPLPVPTNQAQWVSDVPSLNQISNHDYPHFDTGIPDQYRTDIWEQDFKQAEQTGNLPNLTTMTLGDDHTGGAPTGTAQNADNDLAVGRIVSDVSHSQFWKDSAIFVLEDDTQAGNDHVDGHRGPLLIASPYANHGVVNSEYYSQINVVKTIEQILGAQPMNQMDQAAVPMHDAFTNTPDDTPYTVQPNQIPLTQGVTGLLPLTPMAGAVANPSATAAVTATSGPAAPAVPAAEQSVARVWTTWYQTEVTPKLTGANAAPDAANPAQLNRYDWYTSTNWSKPFPGDKQILAPDQVPGRNLPSNMLGD